MCFTIPTAGAIVASLVSRRTGSAPLRWLCFMLWGGAVFGIIDHLWNGELFVVPTHVGSDLALGIAITLSIVALWGVAVFFRAPNAARC
jgi:hypothetical protein